MRITEIKINNFKGFKGEHSFDFGTNLAILVGENNTGKTTLFQAVNFLLNGLGKDKKIEDIITKGLNTSKDEVSVEIKIQGDLSKIISAGSDLRKYQDYIFKEGGLEHLKLRRSSKPANITQKGKDVKIYIKNITIFNSTESQFENPTGFSNAIKSLLDAEFVWADINPDDVIDAGSTKTLGKILTRIISNFFNTPEWSSFQKNYNDLLSAGADAPKNKSKEIEKEITELLKTQHADATVELDFPIPEAKSFLTNATINIDDGIKTDWQEKGSGMQRAVALIILQIYAKYLKDDRKENQKPILFFIDEPEKSLHPHAQDKLIKALITISDQQQIFLTTHSPYLLTNLSSNINYDLYVFSKNNSIIEYKNKEKLKLFSFSPSWGEVNYYAFNMPTTEFHNELYGVLQEKNQKFNEKDIENFFTAKGKKICKAYQRLPNGNLSPSHDITIMTYIRNKIHHPENTYNPDYTAEELKESIETMIELLS